MVGRKAAGRCHKPIASNIRSFLYEVFKKIGDHVAGLKSLDPFTPQNLDNTAWVFATAGVSHTKMFQKIGDHVTGLESLNSFKSQDVSNIGWSYATA